MCTVLTRILSTARRHVTNHHAITFRWEFQLLLILHDDYLADQSIRILDYYLDYRSTVVSFAGRMTVQTGRLSRRTNRYSSSSIILSPILRNESARNRTWLMNHQNSRVFHWMMIRMMETVLQHKSVVHVEKDFTYPSAISIYHETTETLEQSCFSSRLHRDTGQ